jgi:hypothetical protein
MINLNKSVIDNKQDIEINQLYNKLNDFVIINEVNMKQLNNRLNEYETKLINIEKKNNNYITMKEIDELISDIRENMKEFITINTPRINTSDIEIKLLNIDNRINLLNQKIDEKIKLLDNIEIIKKQDINNNDEILIKKNIPKLDLRKSKK